MIHRRVADHDQSTNVTRLFTRPDRERAAAIGRGLREVIAVPPGSLPERWAALLAKLEN